MQRALICPPTGPGSLGDEAMIDGLSTALAGAGCQVHVMTPFPSGSDWAFLPHVERSLEYPSGGPYQTFAALRQILAGYDRVYVIGADVIDGFYETRSVKRMLLVAAVAGLSCRDSRLVSFSFNTNPSSTSVRLLRLLPPWVKVYARDPQSLRRYARITRRRVAQGSDLAYLLPPARVLGGSAAVLGEWLEAQRQIGHRIFALNAGGATYSPLKGAQVDASGIARAYARELRRLLGNRPNLALVLLSHDHRPFVGEHELLKEIAQQIPASVADRVAVLASPDVRAREVKALIPRCDFVVSSRMHLVVSALGTGTPAAAITYQDKFAGQFDLFGLQGNLISLEESLSPGGLERLVDFLVASGPSSRARIQEALPAVIGLATRSAGLDESAAISSRRRFVRWGAASRRRL